MEDGCLNSGSRSVACLKMSEQLLMSDGLFSQSMTGKPYSCLDRNDHEKGFKMKAGWSRFLKNEPMLLIHIRQPSMQSIELERPYMQWQT